MKRTADVYRLSPQSIIVLTVTSAIALLGFIWPFFYTGNLHWIFAVAIAASAFLLISEIGIGSIDAKSIALLGVMSAFITLLRPLGAGAAGLEPIWFALIVAARVFGASWGFLLGVTSMTSSALITGGVGPWLTSSENWETRNSRIIREGDAYRDGNLCLIRIRITYGSTVLALGPRSKYGIVIHSWWSIK